MPYIKYDRDGLASGFIDPDNAGELNFVITSTLLRYLGHGADYAAFNEVIGVLECAKLEMYRRMIAPYEDKKIEENGDVYV